MAWVERHGRGWRVVYYRPDGSRATLPGYPNKTRARRVANALTVQHDAGLLIDPTAAAIPLEAYGATWLERQRLRMAAGDITRNTFLGYEYAWAHARRHLGGYPLGAVTRQLVYDTQVVLRSDGYSAHVAGKMAMVTGMVLEQAVDERRLAANPLRGRRRRAGAPSPARRPVASPLQVLRLAVVLADASPRLGLLALTLAYTGARWHEVVACTTDHLTDQTLAVFPTPEVNGAFEHSRGKTSAAIRVVELPAFLAEALHDQPPGPLFAGARGGLPRRSNVSRRYWQPASKHCAPGVTPHALRHTHNTWLIEAGIPKVARAERMGWKIRDEIERTYSHATAAMNARVVAVLQARWTRSVLDYLELDGVPPLSHLDPRHSDH